MSASSIFAVAYLLGTVAGLLAGLLLPWWLSGTPAYVAAAALIIWPRIRPTDVELRRAFDCGPPQEIGRRIEALMDSVARRNVGLTHGTFWGLLAGAAIASMPAALDWFLWSGHATSRWGCFAAVLVAVGWLFGTLCDVEEQEMRHPGLVGLTMWTAAVSLCALPALWEVL